MTYTARCACGACSVEVEGAPALNAVCHCSNCKKRTGSAFGWSIYFPDAQIRAVSGGFVRYDVPIAIPQQRYFCAACGSTLYWKTEAFPGLTGTAGGCFAEAPPAAPNVTASNHGRCAWLTLPEDWRARD